MAEHNALIRKDVAAIAAMELTVHLEAIPKEREPGDYQPGSVLLVVAGPGYHRPMMKKQWLVEQIGALGANEHEIVVSGRKILREQLKKLCDEGWDIFSVTPLKPGLYELIAGRGAA
jgi:hypothetical protein